MRKLINKNEYLTTDLIAQCFEKGKVNYVDKVVTGNGFTTGFADLRAEFGKVNVLIAPNQSVIKDKEAEHKNGTFANGKRVAFVYEGQGLKGSLTNYDLIVLVSDSFVNYSYILKGNVTYLMVDEFHSAIIQSSFRYKLKKMIFTIDENFKDCAVSFVTASPLLFSNITIQIENHYTFEKDLHTSNDLNESILRCAAAIKRGKRVLLFTQDAAIVKRILKEAQRNDFKLIAGISFTTTLLSKECYTLNNYSNIIIASSAGFEGWSDYSIDGEVFIYMNLGNSQNTFLGANIYQAIGRLRKGYKYAEICITEIGGGGFPNRNISDLNEKIDKLINIDNVSIERKQSNNYFFTYKGNKVMAQDLSQFIYYKRDKEKYKILKYKHANNVHDEINKIDTRLKVYTEYFKTRKVNLVNIDIDISKKRITSRIKREQRVFNICQNITENNLQENFKDFFFKSQNPENKIKYYIEEIETMQEAAYNLGISIPDNYETLKNYFLEGGHYEELKALMIKLKKEWGESARDIREAVKSFDETIFEYSLDVAIGIMMEEFKPNHVAHRDYNKLTLIGIDLIEFIAGKLGKPLIEIDIKNCFPRIVYALNGLELPKDFYGVNRQKNKIKVNVSLNSFGLDRTKKGSESRQKADAKRKLKRAGLDPICIEWLIDKHFNNKFKGDFFNFLAYHEKCLISSARQMLEVYNPNVKMYRRHDSLVCFEQINYSALNAFEFLGFKGWFNNYEF